MELQLGQLVRSKAGRDQGRIMVVVDLMDGSYCRVADGKLRSMDHPKVKNRKHLQACGGIDQDIARTLQAGRVPADQEIVEAIRRYIKL